MNLRLELWAKGPETSEPYPLLCHLLDTASAARSLWRLWLRPRLRDFLSEELGTNAEKIVMLLAGAHDIGKANPVFQLQLASQKNLKWREPFRESLVKLEYPYLNVPLHWAKAPVIRRHERVAAIHLGGARLGENLVSESLPAVVALGHHGSFDWDGTKIGPYKKFALGEWETARNDLVSSLEVACGVELKSIPQVSEVVAVLLSGFIILADRLASQKRTTEQGLDQMRREELDPGEGKEWIQHRQDYFDGLVQELLGVYNGFEDPKREILGDYEPRGAQLLANSAGDGLWFIMTATGSGKTEAFVLRHSDQQEALTLLLPTQATTNAMMRRLQKMFAKTGNVAALAHGDAWLEDFYNQPESASSENNDSNQGRGGLFPTQFVASRASRLLAPVTVATIDQAVMASLPLKWTHLRLLALANSHVVIDEVHTMDEYQVRLLEPILWWLGRTRTRVTLLSATLTQRHRDQFVRAYTNKSKKFRDPVDFPSIASVPLDSKEAVSSVDLYMDKYQIDVELVEAADSASDHHQWAKNTLDRFPRARLGIVVNTIDRAQYIARKLIDDGISVVVLHSRMSLKHRQDSALQLENAIGKNGDGDGLVVVGTQAIEASLDIDLDWMSTDLAPASSLLQRAGRVWRHSDTRRGKRLPMQRNLPLRIVRDTSDVGHLPYFAAELDRAWGFLKDHNLLAVPNDVQDFVETGAITLDEANDAIADFEAVLKELAERTVKTQAASALAIKMDSVMEEYSAVGDLRALTAFSSAAPDTDTDFPSTRYIERESQRILVTGPSASTVPGGWTGTLEALRMIDKKDREATKRALAGVISVGGKILRSLKESMTSIENIPGLLGVIAGPLPEGIKYDPAVGLVKE